MTKCFFNLWGCYDNMNIASCLYMKVTTLLSIMVTSSHTFCMIISKIALLLNGLAVVSVLEQTAAVPKKLTLALFVSMVSVK